MADIVYTRKFNHDDWVDNEDVVQAEGERGFNKKFHSIEDELDSISSSFAVADAEVKKFQRLAFVTSKAGIVLPATSVSPEFPVEIYDRSAMQPNIEKVYFALIFPSGGGNLSIPHTFLYQQLSPATKIQVTVTFHNPTSNAVNFGFRVLTFA